MAKVLDGKQVAAVLNEKLRVEVNTLANVGIKPKLAIIRVGEKNDDMAYERSVMKQCKSIGVEVLNYILRDGVNQGQLVEVIEKLNNNPYIHGCLLFRPLPENIDDNLVRNALAPEKDVDGITDASLAGVFAGTDTGFPPCTPVACMELLQHYDIDLTGKNVVVIGRSLVVGKPLAMMLIKKHATVTVCHTRTIDVSIICRKADILIAAAGRAKVVDKSYLSPAQIVIDVGINVDDEGKLCGDVDFLQAGPIVEAITPVPGGVGALTTSILIKHVVEAAKIRRRHS